MLAHFARLGWQHINLTGDQGQHALELPPVVVWTGR
jgi:hypothetical protein